MAHHRPTYIATGGDKIVWRCSTCGETNQATAGDKQAAEDAALKHAQKIERIRANLGRGRGTLTTDRDHARRMLDDPNTPKQDRPHWQTIYDGAVSRLGEKGGTASEDSLFNA